MARSLRSMTGFGRGTAELGSTEVSAEVRCVNARHLDLRVRLPRELQTLEPVLREAAAPHFQRGQVEIAIRIPPQALAAPAVEIDLEAATRYLRAAEQLRSELELGEPLSVSTLMGLPGVARLGDPQVDSEALQAVAVRAVEGACRAAQQMRSREGEALAAELERRLGAVGAQVGEIEARSDEVRAALRERLEKRLAALAPQLELEPGRLEQEAVIYVDRMDVTEELVRLRSHLAQFEETLQEPGAVGRKLEFLLQEMGREVNTIGSKASDVPVARSVVALKTEFEKLREQVLNVE